MSSPRKTNSTPKKANSTPKKANSTPKKDEVNFDALMKAIKQCLIDNNGVRSTARECNISHSTLLRYITKVTEAFDDVSTVEDSVLLNFIREKGMKLPSNMVIFFNFFF